MQFLKSLVCLVLGHSFAIRKVTPLGTVYIVGTIRRCQRCGSKRV